VTDILKKYRESQFISADIEHKIIDGIVRAFWRRVDMYKNDYNEELPEQMPIPLRAAMITALCLLNDLEQFKWKLNYFKGERATR